MQKSDTKHSVSPKMQSLCHIWLGTDTAQDFFLFFLWELKVNLHKTYKAEGNY